METVNSKTINLSNNKDLFENFYAVVSFDGGSYHAILTCVIESEYLARKAQKNQTGSFSVDVPGVGEVLFKRYSDEKTMRWTELEIKQTTAEKLKRDIELISKAVIDFISQKNTELLDDVKKFDILFQDI
ncbi:MAG: hypothetical protein PHY54_17900 [Methylococcales bacterium]|nr:hypothetical protein [Methylococcales bacterium]